MTNDIIFVNTLGTSQEKTKSLRQITTIHVATDVLLCLHYVFLNSWLTAIFLSSQLMICIIFEQGNKLFEYTRYTEGTENVAIP